MRQKGRVKVNNNKIALYSAQQKQHPYKFETEIMTDVNIFPNPSYGTGKHNLIASGVRNHVLVSFYKAKNISITEKNGV